MKTILFITVLLVSTTQVFGQFIRVGVKNVAPVQFISKVETEKKSFNKVYLKTSFADWQIENPEDFEKIRGALIERIELVHSDFPKGKDFSELNNKRLAALYILAPEIFEQRWIDWKMVKQTECETSYEASRLFHGFVITYRPVGSPEFTAYENNYIKDYLLNTEIPKTDSALYKLFDRNKDWKDMMIVGDLTGSMSPYTAQLLLWLKLTFSDTQARYLTFFNDGDSKQTKEKVVGEVGGIYAQEINNFDQCMSLALTTMHKGSGGDTPENNLEALLYSMNKWKNYKEIVMIADNFATPRDMKLLEKVDKPVRVVLCGVTDWINPAYLKLARETGGSIHTMEEDLKDLVKLKEGQKFKFGKQEFIIQKGEFVQLKFG